MPSNDSPSVGAAATATPAPGWADSASLEFPWSPPGTLRCGFSFFSFLSFLSLSSLAIAVSATERSWWTIGMMVGPLVGSLALAAGAGAARTSNAIVEKRTQTAARFRLITSLPLTALLLIRPGTKQLKARCQASEPCLCASARHGVRDQPPDFSRALAACLNAFDRALPQAGADRFVDRSSGVGLSDVGEKEGERADRGDRTCYSFARVFRRAAVDWLKDRNLAGVDVP